MRALLYLYLIGLIQFACAGGMICAASPARAVTVLGLGLDTHLARGVNPNFATPVYAGEVFAHYGFGHFALAPEIMYAQSRSAEGAYAVRTETWTSSLWGRYLLYEPVSWSPFASAGLGFNFDRIQSTFANASDTRSGRRDFGGAGIGINTYFWEFILAEAEVRLVWTGDQRGPDFDFLLRVGYRF